MQLVRARLHHVVEYASLRAAELGAEPGGLHLYFLQGFRGDDRRARVARLVYRYRSAIYQHFL